MRHVAANLGMPQPRRTGASGDGIPARVHADRPSDRSYAQGEKAPPNAASAGRLSVAMGTVLMSIIFALDLGQRTGWAAGGELHRDRRANLDGAIMSEEEK